MIAKVSSCAVGVTDNTAEPAEEATNISEKVAMAIVQQILPACGERVDV